MGTIIAEVVDNEEKRDGRGHRLTAAGRRAQLVGAYRASGLTMAAFARREKIKYPTFANWVLKAAKHAVNRSAIDFAEVRLPLMSPTSDSMASRLEVRLPDGTVMRGVQVEELAALVRALKG
jgi:hypothetical protein